MPVNPTRAATKQARKDELQQEIADLTARCRLTDWTAFTEAVDVPQDIAVALITQRVEMLALARPRDMTAAEVATLYKLIRVLVETNTALREHAQHVARLTGNWMTQFTGIASVAWQIDHFANFRSAAGEDDEAEG